MGRGTSPCPFHMPYQLHSDHIATSEHDLAYNVLAQDSCHELVLEMHHIWTRTDIWWFFPDPGGSGSGRIQTVWIQSIRSITNNQKHAYCILCFPNICILFEQNFALVLFSLSISLLTRATIANNRSKQYCMKRYEENLIEQVRIWLDLKILDPMHPYLQTDKNGYLKLSQILQQFAQMFCSASICRR